MMEKTLTKEFFKRYLVILKENIPRKNFIWIIDKTIVLLNLFQEK